MTLRTKLISVLFVMLSVAGVLLYVYWNSSDNGKEPMFSEIENVQHFENKREPSVATKEGNSLEAEMDSQPFAQSDIRWAEGLSSSERLEKAKHSAHYGPVEVMYSDFFEWTEGKVSDEELWLLKDLQVEIQMEEMEILLKNYRETGVLNTESLNEWREFRERSAQEVESLLSIEVGKRFAQYRVTLPYRDTVRSVVDMLPNNDFEYEGETFELLALNFARAHELFSLNAQKEPPDQLNESDVSDRGNMEMGPRRRAEYRHLLESELPRDVDEELAIEFLAAFFELHPEILN